MKRSLPSLYTNNKFIVGNNSNKSMPYYGKM